MATQRARGSRPTRPVIPVWAIPLLYFVVSAVAGLTLPRLEHTYLQTYERAMAVSTAQAFLSAVSSGMMALTAITFSIAFLVLQYSATAYSKRFVLLSERSRIIGHALGMCFATFVYSLATLTWVNRFGDGDVPTLSVVLVSTLLIASLVLLAMLVKSLAELRVTRVLRILGDKGRSVIAATYKPRTMKSETAYCEPNGDPTRLRRDEQQALRYIGPPRAVTSIDVDVLVGCARKTNSIIELNCAVGDTLTDGVRLLTVFGVRNQDERDLSLAIHLAPERSFERDPKYALRLLVDTAIMALSPGINDPTTAVQALDEIEDLLHHIGESDLGTGHVNDEAGALRVIMPVPTWDDYLSLSLDEIRIYGAEAPQVLRRLHALLTRLSDSLEIDDRKEALWRYAHHLDADIEGSQLDSADREISLRSDPQGLGLTRHDVELR